MILIATGLTHEARLLRRDGAIVIAGGGRSLALEARLEAHAGAAHALLSMGLAGALGPNLRAGDLVIGVNAIEHDQRRPTDEEWRAKLLASLAGAVAGDVLGADAIVAEASAKGALWARTGAIAVDMESHVVARVATRWCKPFAIVRAISDGAGRTLPPAARVAMTVEGEIDLGAVIRALLARPAQIPDLARTASEAQAGFRSLRVAAHRLDAGFGFTGSDLRQLPIDMT